eukprot:gnl/TRDRNA2_/TRDRNA2_183312_c0_seq1.p1 gnl/TRDRNA2_/TRDRNA2_183312_c0~~gnl/TRDRNA2_/TRDRNA2_183312_c0_seq1.p1  ORF type:complete len:588 (+),score=86.22 gnl/TRDRNA2_/TRDRNA2_183312_c0_seq1:40-1764(+)
MTAFGGSLDGRDICPKRFGLKYDPPCIILEYLRVSTGKLFHRQIPLDHLCASSDPDHVAERLCQKYKDLLGEGMLSLEQLVSLVQKIITARKEKDNKLSERAAALAAFGAIAKPSGRVASTPDFEDLLLRSSSPLSGLFQTASEVSDSLVEDGKTVVRRDHFLARLFGRPVDSRELFGDAMKARAFSLLQLTQLTPEAMQATSPWIKTANHLMSVVEAGLDANAVKFPDKLLRSQKVPSFLSPVSTTKQQHNEVPLICPCPPEQLRAEVHASSVEMDMSSPGWPMIEQDVIAEDKCTEEQRQLIAFRLIMQRRGTSRDVREFHLSGPSIPGRNLGGCIAGTCSFQRAKKARVFSERKPDIPLTPSKACKWNDMPPTPSTACSTPTSEKSSTYGLAPLSAKGTIDWASELRGGSSTDLPMLDMTLEPWPMLEMGVIAADICTEAQLKLIESRAARGPLSQSRIEKRRKALAERLGCPGYALNPRFLEEMRPSLGREAALEVMRVRWATDKAQEVFEYEVRAKLGELFVVWPYKGKWPMPPPKWAATRGCRSPPSTQAYRRKRFTKRWTRVNDQQE